MKGLNKTLMAATLASLITGQAHAGNVEVLHYWTSGGEAAALAILQKMMKEEGHSWTDFAVAGGGGETAMTVLKSRAISGNPPSASMIAGPEIAQWGDLGVLAKLDEVATSERWDALLPKAVADIHKYQGSYVAAPVNVHRINWMWINKPILDQVNGGKVPQSWDEFFVFMDKAKQAGFVAFAHGGQDWQDATVFEQVALGVGGDDWYRQAFVALDKQALSSDTMTQAFATFKKLKSYMDPGMPGRDWNLTTAMVIDGKAAVQIMGDWAKGEFAAAGKQPGKDYLCATVPGTQNAFNFNVDAFMMFEQKSKEAQAAQEDLSRLLVSKEFQEEFNLKKGSIPVRPDVSLARYDSCAKQSMSDFQASAKSGSLVPSFAHAMAMEPAVSGAVYDVVTNYFNDNDMTADAATLRLVSAIELAQ